VLALVFAGAPQFGALLVQSLEGMRAAPMAAAWTPFAAALVSLVCSLILQGAVTRAAIDDLSSKRVSFMRALSEGVSHILPLIGLGILAGIAMFLGFILFIVPGLLLLVRWVAAGPAVVVEDLGPTRAMERSADLSRDHRWAIFGLCALYVVTSWAASFG